MLVQNIGKKVIGFGAVALPPDAVGTLPAGYGPEHPVVKFYLDKKWIKEVKGGKSVAPKVDTPPEPELTEEEKAKMAKKAELAAKIKAVGKLNLEPLRVEATNLDIEWTESDTKAVLAQKITEYLQANFTGE